MKKLSVIFIIGTLSILLTISALIGFLSYKNYKPSVAFYNIDSSTQEIILSMLDDDYKTVILNSDIPLSAQKSDFKNCSLIFSQTDYDVIEFCNSSKKVKTVPEEFLNGMSSTVVDFTNFLNGNKTSGKSISGKPVSGTGANSSQSKIKLVPLLFDFYQIDIDFAAYKEFSSKNSNRPLNYWDDFTEFLELYAKTQKNPLTFYGKDEKNLLAITGMLAEGLTANENAPTLYENFCSALYQAYKTDIAKENYQNTNKNKNPTSQENSNYHNVRQVLEEACSPNGFLYPAIKEFSKMIKNQISEKTAFQLDQTEMNFYLENGISVSAFLKLSEHRKIDHKIINKFSSIYFPSKTDRVSRKFAAPCICVIPLKNKAKITNQIEQLCNNRQTELSTRTGLSPVQKNCSVADHQADDVRYWIAASDGPVLPIYAAIPSKQIQAFCTNLILEHILQ
ncbi:MAG: hypothetical protein K6A43_04320 [Treponema sp.]|nr:hypothetical protein [Treponema sp.]